MARETLDQTSGSAFERKDGHECEGDHYQPIGVRAQRRQKAAARMHRNLKPMRFVSLHHHTTYSYLDGFQLPEAHIRRAGELNMGAMAFTEHGNIFSHVKAETAAKDSGVKPIFGCEVYMGHTDEKRRTQRKNHLTVLAADQEGYANLLRLVSDSWKEGFYHEPTVSPEMLVRHRRGLIILSGCQGSALFTALMGGKHVAPEDASYARAKKVAQWFKRKFGDSYYLEVQAFPELEKTCQANPQIMRMGRELGIDVVATLDCHYTAPEEAEIQKVLHNCRPGEKRTVEQMAQDWGYDVPLCPPATDKAIYRKLRATGLSKQEAIDAIINTEVVAQRCNVTLPKLPQTTYPLPEGYTTPEELWRDWLREGWLYRKCNELPKAERKRYKEQLAKEMEIIEAKGYTNYFLIMADAIRFGKEQQIPIGPARGSAAASLACWLLRITEVNPLLFPNLVFERFIDWSRKDMPDIDIDWAAYGRPIIRDYLEAKYGHVTNIGTFTMYKPKLAIDDVARVHRVPKHEVETVKNLLVERSSGDLRASAAIEDTVEQFETARDVVERYPELRYSMDLEGNAKGFGVHAAGLAVSNNPITEVCAILEKEVPAGSGNVVQVASMDKWDAERQGLEKLDFLSLSTMDMIAGALSWLDMKLEELYDLPLDDQKVMDGFRENDTVGVFQFDGRATRAVCGALKPDTFEEIADTNALSRPGPLHSGAAGAYIEVKHGLREADKLHPALEAITEKTNYQIVYQEQILRVVTEIGQFEWTDAHYIRKIMSKKLGREEFSRQWDRYIKGATTIHERTDYPPMSEAIAKKIWDAIITAGAYAFNAAHSYSYGMIAYWTMWLKVYHPTVFYAASLAHMPKGTNKYKGKIEGENMDKHYALRRDAVKHEIELAPPHPVRSDATWKPVRVKGRPLGEGTLLAGFEQVKGVGEKTAARMVEYREELPRKERRKLVWDDYLNVTGIGPKTMETIREFVERDDPFNVYKLDQKVQGIRTQIEEGELPGLPTPTHSGAEVPYEKGRDTQVVYLGMPIHRNLRDIYESHRSRTGTELDPATVKQPDLSEFMVVLCTDGDVQVNIRVDRFKYPRFKEMLWGTTLGEDMILVKGVKPGFRDAREIYANQIWVLEDD